MRATEPKGRKSSAKSDSRVSSDRLDTLTVGNSSPVDSLACEGEDEGRREVEVNLVWRSHYRQMRQRRQVVGWEECICCRWWLISRSACSLLNLHLLITIKEEKKDPKKG